MNRIDLIRRQSRMVGYKCKAISPMLQRIMTSALTMLVLILGIGNGVGAPEANAEELDLIVYQYEAEGVLRPLAVVQKWIRHLAEYGACRETSGSDSGSECWHLNDTKKWAESTTEWKYPGGNTTDGTISNAFKHCIWIRALATRLGETGSYRAGFVHEEFATNQPEEFRQMDEWNNFIGAKIGADAKRENIQDQWGHVMDRCYSLAQTNQLYGPGGVKGGYANG